MDVLSHFDIYFVASTDTLLAPLPKLTIPVQIFMPRKSYMFRMLLLLGVVFLSVAGPREEEGIAAPKPDLPTAAVCKWYHQS